MLQVHSAALMERQEAGVLVLSDTATLQARKFNPLCHLTAAERERVLGHCTPMLAKRHSTIFRQGEAQKGIYIILSGGVRVFFGAPTGREITRAYWFAGHFIGGPDVFADTPHMWSAITIRDTSLLMIPSGALRKLCNGIPNLAMGLIEAMVFKGRCYAAMAQMLGTRSAAQRMAQVLMHLGDLYGTETPDGIEIELSLTQEEIAHMVGATRQWVAIRLKQLHAANVICAGRGRLLIREAETLSTMG